MGSHTHTHTHTHSLCRRTSSRIKGLPFRPISATPVDLFPHTPHCEVVILLERISQEELSGKSHTVGYKVIDEVVKKETQDDEVVVDELQGEEIVVDETQDEEKDQSDKLSSSGECEKASTVGVNSVVEDTQT